MINEVFNTNIAFYSSIGLVLLLYYIAEFSTSMFLALYCMQKASIVHHWQPQWVTPPLNWDIHGQNSTRPRFYFFLHL